MGKNSLPFLLLLISMLRVNAQERSGFIIYPYLQYATSNSIRIQWETADAVSTGVCYGKATLNTSKPVWDEVLSIPGVRRMHYAVLTNLLPETVYFYQTVSVLSNGDSLFSDISSFQTAVKDSTAFAFAVFGDSQINTGNPGAWGQVSNQAWKERPNFAVHAGDLVDLGYRKDDWVNEFFSPAKTLMQRIPVYSIPGNHEHDAAYYYRYMYVPRPYYYSFRYGNAEVFMIDTNQYQEPGTDMYNWLEQALARSAAYWKFVVHHHPPYSSDDDDFGDTRSELSTLGDSEARGLTSLYEKYGVDIVFYGHIHAYERTWPIRSGKTVNSNGVIYINTGGAGGKLETPSPVRSWFTSKLRTTHHFGYVGINGNNLQYQAIDENGILFDSFVLTHSRKELLPPALIPAAPVTAHNRRIFKDTIQVEWQAALPDEVIRYTLDNSEPGSKSPECKQKIVLSQSTTIKAASFNKLGKSRTQTIHYIKEKAFDAVSVKRPQPGLHYRYFSGAVKNNDPDKFQNHAFSKEVAVSDINLNEVPHAKQGWGLIYNGYIKVPVDGYYRFAGLADHMVRLTIHDKVLFEELDRDICADGDIYLKAGYHPVKIEYFADRTDRFSLELYYTGPGIQRQPIPAALWWREGR